MNEIKQNKWYQVIIPDEAALPGTSILELLKCIMKVEHFEFVILDEIVGAGKNWLMRILKNHQQNVMRVKDLMFTLPDVQQFEWGDFFLFKEYPELWDEPEKTKYPYLINQTDTTISADDYFYMVVYTPHDSVINNINKKKYEIRAVKNNFLKNLDYPSLTLLK